MRYIQRSLDLWRADGDTWGIAVGTGTLGVYLRRLGDRVRAEEHLVEAQMLARQVGDVWGVAMMYAQLGVMAHERRDFERAAEQFRGRYGPTRRASEPP